MGLQLTESNAYRRRRAHRSRAAEEEEGVGENAEDRWGLRLHKERDIININIYLK